MARNTTIAGRIREVLLDGRWIANTNFKDQLQQVDQQQATTKIGSLNTIAALTYHINYYLDGLLRAFHTGILDISDKYSFDMPPVNTEADWLQLRDTLFANAEKFADYVAQMPDAQFDAPFIDEKYGDYLRNIEAVIEHSYYHLGQVSLIRKMIAEQHIK
jgi:hypothetical protein